MTKKMYSPVSKSDGWWQCLQLNSCPLKIQSDQRETSWERKVKNAKHKRFEWAEFQESNPKNSLNCICTSNNSLSDTDHMSWMITQVFHRPAHLLLDKYWPIFSWLFHSSLCRAKTLPSLMKDRLWLRESLAGQSEAMSRKNLEENQKFKLAGGGI